MGGSGTYISRNHRAIDTALVMAGGSGQRMRSSGVPVAKPLITALGVPLLERNIHALLRSGVRKIVVAVPASLPEVESFVQRRVAALVRAAGAEVVCFIEKTPLGNIGCAGLLRDETDALLVVYADNLTTLDLRMVAAEHFSSAADMTIATHKQPFCMPFGEVLIEDGDVHGYIEKPTYHYDVCSAISVLGPVALTALADDRPTGLSELVQSLIKEGRRVRSVPHAAPWIDVNDATSLPLAEKLIAAHQREFDLWATDPGEPLTFLCDLAGDRVRLWPPQRASSFWTLIKSLTDPGALPMMVFDDFDDENSHIRRFSVERRYSSNPPSDIDSTWWPVPLALTNDAVSPIAKRTLAFAIQVRESA